MSNPIIQGYYAVPDIRYFEGVIIFILLQMEINGMGLLLSVFPQKT